MMKWYLFLNGRGLISAIICGFIFWSCNVADKKQPDARPNIVLILADDLGFSDLGCYGGEIQTPHLDRLANNGIRFSQFYNTSRCCPTRASILTGLYNHQAGIGDMTTDTGQEGYRGHLSDHAVTLAEVLKLAGYHTGMVGKWHVSNTLVQDTPEKQLKWLNHQTEHEAFSPIDQYPTNRGFEKYFGNIWGVVDFFDPFSLVNGTETVTSVSSNYFHTDAINDTASAYIREFAKDEQPFFLYVAHTAPHWPLHALPEDIEKYKDTYKEGWNAISEERYEKMLNEGIIDATRYPLTPPWAEEQLWEENVHKDWDARAMAVHAAMIDRMDQGIGRIVSTLKETGQLDNTLILFLSDNGASPENCMRYGPGFDRPGATRTGETIHYPVDKDLLPGPQTTFTSIGQKWANVANTPFSYWKMESYEGGVHTPMIAHWPDGISVKNGAITSHLGHITDFMATFVELARVQYPQKYKGKDILPLAGESFIGVFSDTNLRRNRTLFNEHMGGSYVRNEEWKLVKLHADTPWELYRIREDRTEMNNLADQYPKVVEELDRLWHDWTRQNNVLPKP